MKFKRILSVFLVMISILGISAVSVGASETEYTWAEGWDVGTNSYAITKGVNAEVTAEYANSGTYSLKVWNRPEGNTRVWTSVRGLTVGEKYTVSGYIRVDGTLPTGARIRILPDRGSGDAKKHGVSKTITTTTSRFEKVSATFTMPDQPSVVIGLDSGKIPDGCVIYWDDITVEGVETDINGGFEKIIEVRPPEMPEVPEGFTNQFVNNSFEINDGTVPEGWEAYKEWKDNPLISLTNEHTHTGNWAVKVKLSEEDKAAKIGSNPWIRQLIPVQPGTKYVMSVWARTDEPGSFFRFKVEQYTECRIHRDTIADGTVNTDYYYPTGEWQQYWCTFSSSIEAYGVALYQRLYGTGSVYFDDVEVYPLTLPDKTMLETDWCFYREYHEVGTATVTPMADFNPEGTSVDFTFKDGEKLLLSQEKRPLTAEGVTFTYPVNGSGSLITEKGKAYDITATLYDADGNVLETQTTPVYRIDSSPYIRKEDGVFLKDKKTPFYPYIAYHSSTAAAEHLAKIGVNAIQFNITATTTMETLDKWLLEAEESGLMLLVKLYIGMVPPAHPDADIERVRDVITKCKDHPNTMGYMVMDEPFIWFERKAVIEYLRESYLLIKSIDPEHPVYILDNNAPTFKDTAKYCDMMAHDSYVRDREDAADFVAEETEIARIAKRGEVASYAIVQAFDYTGEVRYFPNADQYRSSLYQALFEGAEGTGFFSYAKAIKTPDGEYTPLRQTDLWPGMVEYAEVDMDMAHKVFIGGEIPTLNDVRNEEYWCRLWEKDGKLYLVVLNKDAKNSKTVEIPLTSFDGSLKVGNFSAKIISGGEGSFSGTDVLKAELQPCAAQLWEITPAGPVDTSSASRFTYFDMNTYGWARKAAETLKEKGITEDADVYAFRPGEKITRAEFAGFLVRTLGLKADSTENFADVTAKTPYAAEIAIGRALGILKGTDGVNYNPDAEISRQDLMVICARGMRLIKELAEGGNMDFSDKEAIADYAVLDIAAVVRAGIVRGNADGTLNPLGNTTRAEGAVIMDRIAAWSANS
ncbi:MAG: S-layer homology domain-containing protein [Clostridia bacterium]|nr:S-layer homology domain-containing protein [Clostridia bacterium]